ncbi:hypothetical protein AWH67_00940 [Bartonella bacilliformis]|nr:hypothetical protein AWH67_00940 [Bartonella bacilliformis]
MYDSVCTKKYFINLLMYFKMQEKRLGNIKISKDKFYYSWLWVGLNLKYFKEFFAMIIYILRVFYHGSCVKN